VRPRQTRPGPTAGLVSCLQTGRARRELGMQRAWKSSTSAGPVSRRLVRRKVRGGHQAARGPSLTCMPCPVCQQACLSSRTVRSVSRLVSRLRLAPTSHWYGPRTSASALLTALRSDENCPGAPMTTQCQAACDTISGRLGTAPPPPSGGPGGATECRDDRTRGFLNGIKMSRGLQGNRRPTKTRALLHCTRFGG
jgi:hypothetical protein